MAAPSSISGLFDHYGRQARLFPGLLTIFPPLLAVLAWFPWLIVSSVGATLFTLATSCGLLYALSSWTRTKGRRVEMRLLKEWGGWPTTILLRHTSDLDPNTRGRYHKYLSRNVPDLVLPSSDEEEDDPSKADNLYASGVLWLKERVRSNEFPMIDRENAQYGFRRNLRGLKNIGVLSCLVTVVVSLAAISYQIPGFELLTYDWSALIVQLGAFGAAVWSSLAVNLIAMVAWGTIVTDAWVREGGDQYARALLASCDQLQRQDTL